MYMLWIHSHSTIEVLAPQTILKDSLKDPSKIDLTVSNLNVKYCDHIRVYATMLYSYYHFQIESQLNFGVM